MFRGPFLRWAMLLAALAMVMAACGSSDDATGGDGLLSANDATEATSAAAEQETVEQDGSFSGVGDDEAAAAPVAGGDADRLGGGGVQPVTQPSDIGRDIIFTAEITVAVTDVAAAGEEATNAIEALGGFLFGQQTQGGPNPHSVLTFKVLPENFGEALSRLGTIGELRTQNVSADDVTERVVDLESRIATANASVARLRGFLEGATDIDTIAQLEAQLLQRETDLETLRGTLRTIQGQVDLATIFLTLTEAQSRPEISVSLTAYLGHEDGGASCPGTQGLSVDKGSDVTLCYEILNTGDTNLTDFTFRDAALELELEDLVLVFGDLTTVVEPGESLVLAAEVRLDRNLRTTSRITATPVNADGELVEGRDVSNTSTSFVGVIDPGGLPGFGDGVSASWRFLQRLWGVLLLLAGVIVPFIWIVGLVFAWRWWQRRKDAESVASASPVEPSESSPQADEKVEDPQVDRE